METSTNFLYMEIAELIRKKIREGMYKVGSMMPSQRIIADKLAVNRASVKRAIAILEKEGIIECIPSVGTVVKRLPQEKMLIGYLVRSLKDPFHLEMIREMDKLLIPYNAGLIVAEGESADRLLAMGAKRIVKGGQLEHTSEEDKVKTVYIGSNDHSHFSISIDNKKGMELIYDHLKGLGHRRISFISSKIEIIGSSTDIRFTLLKDLAETEEEKEYINTHSFFIESYSEIECARVIEEILDLDRIPTALVCSSDWLAIEITQQALGRGISIPDELSITGFDNIYMSSMLNIPLTTINFPIRKAAEETVRALFEEKDKPYQIICEPELLVRESTTQAKKEFINI